MTVSLRAIWMLSPFESSPLFERYFTSVELRAKKNNNYVPVPKFHTFLDAVLIETGVRLSDTFVPSRDGCKERCWAPAFELQVPGGALAPVVVLQHRGWLLCALPLLEALEDTTHSSFHAISLTMDCLMMIAEHLTGDLSQKSIVRSQLQRFVSLALPFGQPACLSANLAEQLFSAGSREVTLDKNKQFIWNPYTAKGKGQITFHISEQVHFEQSISGKTSGSCSVCGTVWVSVGELAGASPEVSLSLSHPARPSCLTLAPRAQTTLESDGVTSLSFSASSASRVALCHYTLDQQAPVEGELSIQDVGERSLLRLVLQPIKASLSRLEVVLSPLNGEKGVLRLEGLGVNVSMGIVAEEGGSLRWEVPPSKLRTRPAEFQVYIPLTTANKLRQEMKCHAQVCFKMDQTWSSCKILPHSVSCLTTPKLKCTYTAETISGQYFI